MIGQNCRSNPLSMIFIIFTSHHSLRDGFIPWVIKHDREFDITVRYILIKSLLWQFDLLNLFLRQFWPIKPSGYGCILVETNKPPGDGLAGGLVTVDSYKMIEKSSSASPRYQKHIPSSLIGQNYRKNLLSMSYWSLLHLIIPYLTVFLSSYVPSDKHNLPYGIIPIPYPVDIW